MRLAPHIGNIAGTPFGADGDPMMMRTTRDPETEEQRSAREAQEAREREERISADDRAIDAAVRRSINLHGA